MKKENLFITNYSRIEHEVIVLSMYVDFSDEQLDVYSPVICDLLLRCGAEIESLSKELYRRDVGKKLPKYFKTIANKLDSIYSISEKCVVIDYPGFNFRQFFVLKPFSYEPKTPDDFYNAYCGLKHDRGENYRKATLRLMLLALSGLYILNQLFLNKELPIKNDFFGEEIPIALSENTEIFSVYVFNQDWDALDRRFEDLKSSAGLKATDIDKLKKRLADKMGLKGNNNQCCRECLYRVEFTSEYKRVFDAWNASAGNEESFKNSFLYYLFGDEKVVNEALDKCGSDIFDSIISLVNVVNRRNRLVLKINRNERIAS